VRDAYLARARAEPARMRIIDAAADLPTIRNNLEKALVFN
jgi:hypothetical protein